MEIRLEHIAKRFGTVSAVQDLTLHIDSGDMVALLGPSGCGKSTTLMMLAGIYKPSSGLIYFGEQVVNNLRPQERKIGMVFQSYALYPHMTIYQNIAFPLTIQKLSALEIKERVHQVAELVNVQNLLERKPDELSGGQQQRVSLARALVKQPKILLLDEPLSNLDAALRLEMRVEIRKLQKELGITAIFVTHDQTEAMTIADKVAVMNNGSLMAYEQGLTLYEEPPNQFVAEFLGSPPINLIPLIVQDGKLKSKVNMFSPNLFLQKMAMFPSNKLTLSTLTLGIRPEQLSITSPVTGELRGKVLMKEALGYETIYTISSGEQLLRVRTTDPKQIEEGELVGIQINWSKALWFNEQGERLDLSLPKEEQVEKITVTIPKRERKINIARS